MLRRLLPASRALGPHELAEAAVLGDLSLILAVAGWFLPFGGLFFAAAAVPFAALVVRRRLRALVVGAASACAIGFLALGVGFVFNLGAVAGCGLVVGIGLRRGWGRVRTVALGLGVGWTLLAGLTDGLLAVLPGARRLTLRQVDIAWRAVRRVDLALHLRSLVRFGDVAVPWFIRHWSIAIPAFEVMPVVVGVLLARAIALPVLRRSAEALPPSPDAAPEPDGAPGPAPVVLEAVSFRHPGAGALALHDVSLRVPAGAFVVVLGANGAGKSTLAAVLAGREPSSGAVTRGGTAALGRAGGTAMVFQRPETQVLGVRVREDVLWGLADQADVPGLLARVGLAGFEDRETSTLSGGELQRLALAAALARRPALLISDESTAMVDPTGRRSILRLLRELADAGLTVVHVTHRTEEAAEADMVVRLSEGRVVAGWAGLPGGRD